MPPHQGTCGNSPALPPAVPLVTATDLRNQGDQRLSTACPPTLRDRMLQAKVVRVAPLGTMPSHSDAEPRRQHCTRGSCIHRLARPVPRIRLPAADAARAGRALLPPRPAAPAAAPRAASVSRSVTMTSAPACRAGLAVAHATSEPGCGGALPLRREHVYCSVTPTAQLAG